MGINKSKKTIFFLFIFFITLILLGGSYAYFVWYTTDDLLTSVTFNATGAFSCSARGGASITGSEVSLVPTTCEDSAHVIKKEISTNVKNITGTSAYMNMWLEIDTLGSYLSNNEDFKFVLTTSGDSCSTGVVSSGNFKELTQGGRVLLIEEKEFASSKEDAYYLWIWLDASETEIPPLEEDARSFELSLNGECSDKEVVEDFAVTNSSTNYQLLNVIAENKIRNITSYAITTSSEEPTEWTDIESTEVGKTYNLSETVSETGTYNVWFRDTNGNTTSEVVEVTEIDSIAPVCSWGDTSKKVILEGETSTINLTCTDIESGLDDVNLTKDDISVNAMTRAISNSIIILDVTRSNVENGYKYTVTLTHGSEYGSAILSLNSDKVKDMVGNITENIISEQVTYADVYTIAYKDIGNEEFSGTHEEGYKTE